MYTRARSLRNIDATLPLGLVFLAPHLACIPSMALQILPKLQILTGDGILPDVWQTKERDDSTQDAQARGHEERILTTARAVGPTWRIVLNDREDIGADEGANLARRGSNGVVLASDGRGRGLGSDETDIVARSGLTQREKDAVDNDEAGDVRFGVEESVASCHDETHAPLEEDENGKGVLWTDPIADEGTGDGAREIENVDEGCPAEGLPDRSIFAQDDRDPGGGVDAEAVGAEVVDEPDQTHNEEAEPVEAEDQEPWRADVPHALAVELLWLIKFCPEIDETERGNAAQTQHNAPCCSKMAIGTRQDHNHRDKRRGDEADVDLDVREHDEPAVTMTGLQLPGRLCARDTSGWILATMHCQPCLISKSIILAAHTQSQYPGETATLSARTASH